jgi:hypothetical protein
VTTGFADNKGMVFIHLNVTPGRASGMCG